MESEFTKRILKYVDEFRTAVNDDEKALGRALEELAYTLFAIEMQYKTTKKKTTID